MNKIIEDLVRFNNALRLKVLFLKGKIKKAKKEKRESNERGKN